MIGIEEFSEKDLALALFDCINTEFQQNMVVCRSSENYERMFQELMKTHEDAPITGVKSMDFSAGIITFVNGAELWFTIRPEKENENTEEESEEAAESPPEGLNEFLGEFKVS